MSSVVERATVPTIDGLISEPPIAVTTSATQHPRLRPDRLHERLAERQPAQADHEVADREDAEAGHQAALEAVAVDDRPREQRQEVEQRVEDRAGEEGRGLRAEAHLLGDEDREDGLAAVVGEALEELEHVGDPEGPAETAAHGIEGAQGLSSSRGSPDLAFLPAPRQPARAQARVPPTVISETRIVGSPTPTGTLWPAFWQVPIALVEREIVADPGHLGEHVGSVADQRRAEDGRSEPAVLDQVGLGRGEDELPARDVDLAPAEVLGEEAAWHRADDLLGVVLPRQHEGVRHARQRERGVALAPAVAGRAACPSGRC